MSKKVKSILIGGVVLVVLVGALLALLLIPKEEAGGESDLLGDKDITTLVNENSDDLKSIKVTNQYGEYTINRTEDEAFELVELAGLPHLTSKLSSAKMDASSISASRTIQENCESLSDYGLAEPALRLQIEFTNGNKYDLSIGSVTADGIYRYCTVTGENTVYTVSNRGLETFDVKIYDYLDKTILSEYGTDESVLPDVREVRVERKDWEKPLVIEEMTEDKKIISTDPLVITSPTLSMINAVKLEDYVYNLFGLTAADIAGVRPTGEELAQYGLDDPEASLMMTYDQEKTKVSFLLGKGLDAEGNPVTGSKTPVSYYLMKEGGEIVYVVSAADIPWATMQQGAMISSILTLPYLSDANKIDILLNGKEYEMTVKRLEDDSADTSSQDAAKVDLELKVNGQLVDEAEGRRFYQILLNSSAQGYTSDEKMAEVMARSSNPTMQTKIHLSDGTVETLSYWVEEDLSTIIGYNGVPGYIGRSGYVDKVEKELQNLLNGQAVDINW